MRPAIASGTRVLTALTFVALIVGPATTPVAAQQADSAEIAASVTAALETVASSGIPALPAASAFRRGGRTIPAGDTAAATVAVADGRVDVFGTVTGDVVTIRGDIVLHQGGSITGNAIAIDGAVLNNDGTIGGDVVMLSNGGAAPARPAGYRLARQIGLVGGWMAVLLLIGVGVLTFASDNLIAVTGALELHYGRSLVAGLAGQLGLAPALVALVVALTLSLLGILLIPFAVVVYVILVAGLLTLGFLATAVVIGRGLRPGAEGSRRAARAAMLRAMIAGLVALLSPWLAAALLVPWPTAESVARAAAVAITWVAATAGLGATLVSRAGIRRMRTRTAEHAMASPGWQTPTPVSGVVAGRRPVATPSPGPR